MVRGESATNGMSCNKFVIDVFNFCEKFIINKKIQKIEKALIEIQSSHTEKIKQQK